MLRDSEAHASTHLADYTPSSYFIDATRLAFELGETATIVSAELDLRRNPAVSGRVDALALDGVELELLSIAINGAPLATSRYRPGRDSLVIDAPPAQFTLATRVRIHPENNAALSGLYKSGGNFCTQCEAEGFRRITWYLDRPDVLARFNVRIEADRNAYPVLLSNGNPGATGALDDGRHFAEWEDPFPKPAYLFALVAGKLACREGEFTTASGREVELGIYVQKHNYERSAHALDSLKRAMRWDEEHFGRECDLDRYSIVAVDDFNMGAMENKGLNLFNSKYIMADTDTATDRDYEAIEAVIGHEYFHNWTGNRVTLRDWFQLSLKEGLTVFREQSFAADMGSAAVKRIGDVRLLREVQFAEDSGPMAHPVRPESYMEINNFYTPTVYEKGAEVIRMYRTLLGEEGFRRGMDLYFERHDGAAVTTDDFLAAMADANDTDLDQFSRWYRVAGTPRLEVTGTHDAEAHTYTLSVRQVHAASPSQPAEEKPALLIPIAVGLLDAEGTAIPLKLAGEGGEPVERVLWLREFTQDFVFEDIAAPPTPSLLRGLSAPVKLVFPYGDDDLAHLIAHDSDAFNRWNAAQTLATRVVKTLVATKDPEAACEKASAPLVEAFRALLSDEETDPALAAEVLRLPPQTALALEFDEVPVDALDAAHRSLKRHIAAELESECLATCERTAAEGEYRHTPEAAGRRRLHAAALAGLCVLEKGKHLSRAERECAEADNMTDRIGALVALSGHESPQTDRALAEFRKRYDGEPLVLDKWFALQAASPLPGALARVRALMDDPAFKFKNPNRVRALIGSFARGNHAGFHDENGEAYRFIADQVLALDAFNPQVAARLVVCFTQWHRYDPKRRRLARGELERIAETSGLSRDVYEIVERSLGD
ncbi:MAG: aminopeptidase N [Gammaproteobacteria bacterium]